MSDLSDFLLARIAEDEADAPDVHELDCDLVRNGPVDPGFGWTCSCDLPARVLADCEAKRLIVEGHAETWELGRKDYLEGVWRSEDHAIRLLAAVYADHPDYREEWRP